MVNCATCGKDAEDSNIGIGEVVIHRDSIKIIKWETESGDVYTRHIIDDPENILKPGRICFDCANPAEQKGTDLDSEEFQKYLKEDGFGDRICYIDSSCYPLREIADSE